MPEANGSGATQGSPATVVSQPVLEARHVTKFFPYYGDKSARRLGPKKVVHAIEDASLALYAGRCTALVGESGCGKSTFARVLAGLYGCTSGEVLFHGEPVHATRGRARRQYVGDVQLILQDPFGSFNPMLSIARHLRRALRIHAPDLKGERLWHRLEELLELVKVVPPRQFLEKYPHELSGGQLQRISIARALAAAPSVILADEPVSNLDVSIRLGVLNLLAELTSHQRVALLYVTHDVASARYFAFETAVMYAGELIEGGPSDVVTGDPAHPYTRLLISSAPDPSRQAGERIRDVGQPPSLVSPPSGCRFHPRCPFAMERCRSEPPPRFELSESHWARCFLYARTNGPVTEVGAP